MRRVGDLKRVLALSATAIATVTCSVSASADEPTAENKGTGSATATAQVSLSASGDDIKTTTLPWILTGLGGAQIVTGIVLLAVAPSLPSNCSDSARTCTRLPGESDAALKDDQDRAGRSQQLPVWGAIALASGGFFAATGLGMYFYYKDSGGEPARSATLTPYATPGGGGLAALGTF